jgi:hypothetical protein
MQLLACFVTVKLLDRDFKRNLSRWAGGHGAATMSCDKGSVVGRHRSAFIRISAVSGASEQNN